MHLKMISVSSGGNGHFAVAPADGDEVMVVGFGQGCVSALRFSAGVGGRGADETGLGLSWIS